MFPSVQKTAAGEQKAGSFSRIKNKEVSRDPSVGLAFGWLSYVSGQAEHVQGHKSYLSFSVLMKHPGQEGLRLGPRNLFQQNYALLTKFNLWPAFI